MKSIALIFTLTTLYDLAITARKSSAVYSWLDENLDSADGSSEQPDTAKRSKFYLSHFLYFFLYFFLSFFLSFFLLTCKISSHFET